MKSGGFCNTSRANLGKIPEKGRLSVAFSQCFINWLTEAVNFLGYFATSIVPYA
jgi:hypothetical protein